MADSIVVGCACGKRLSVRAEAAGKKTKCPRCGEVVRIPGPAGGSGKPATGRARAPRRAEGPVGARPAPVGPAPDTKPRSVTRSCPACSEAIPLAVQTCPHCGELLGARRRAAEEAAAEDGGTFAPEKAGIRAGMVGGIIIMAIAAIWFVGGLAAGILFYYPPVLFVIGIFAFVKGLVTGNVAGERTRRPRSRRPRRAG
ncbi:MAG: hypothetical protein HY720_02600 [Planctomycetes bacterium]|nr:hypothetical protein [Planctomycetota bacterium]